MVTNNFFPFFFFLFLFFFNSFVKAETSIIRIDGSSTVYPITEAVAEEYRGIFPAVKVLIGISGTGGGFKKFCASETDITNASRPIKQIERELCEKNGISYVEIPIAYDALSVIVNPKNTWITSVTVDELKRIWEPSAQGVITKWNHIRAEWPDRPISLFGPGVDSGTYDYFTEVVVGKEHSSRGDFTSSEDDNVLVQGIASDINALGFFGMAYYVENKDKLKVLAVDDGIAADGDGPQLPTIENVIAGVYRPLARPLFIYVRSDALAKDAIKNFISFYVSNAPALSTQVGYIELDQELQQLARSQVENNVTGSIYTLKDIRPNMRLSDLIRAYREARMQKK